MRPYRQYDFCQLQILKLSQKHRSKNKNIHLKIIKGTQVSSQDSNLENTQKFPENHLKRYLVNEFDSKDTCKKHKSWHKQTEIIDTKQFVIQEETDSILQLSRNKTEQKQQIVYKDLSQIRPSQRLQLLKASLNYKILPKSKPKSLVYKGKYIAKFDY